MIVWGGSQDSDNEYDSGGRYDPASDSWTPTSVAGYWQRASANQTSIWTGNELIYWGFDGGNDSGPGHGIVFNPTTGAWTSTSLSSAPAGLRRNPHGGLDRHGDDRLGRGWIRGSVSRRPVGATTRYSTPGRRSPTSDDPSALRTKHTAVWTGDEMIVWGGAMAAGIPAGATTPHRQLDADVRPNAPVRALITPPSGPASEMIVWGGQYRSGVEFPGRPVRSSDRHPWQPIALSGSSGWRGGSAAVWTGSEMLVWGGKEGGRSADRGQTV